MTEATVRYRIIIRAGALVFLIAVLAGPLYTEPGYDWVRHSIGELAAQNTRNAWIMRFGLFCLGAATVLGYFRERSRFNVFFLFFGLTVGLSAFLPHKPFTVGRPFPDLLDQWHSAFATLGGFGCSRVPLEGDSRKYSPAQNHLRLDRSRLYDPSDRHDCTSPISGLVSAHYIRQLYTMGTD
ncbi:MAG: DUF998 domain-containing protein [Woeseia sp.]